MMMYKLLTLVCTLSGILLLTEGCKSAKETTTMAEDQPSMTQQAVEQLAEMRLGQPYLIEWNESKHYALVTKKMSIRTNDPYPTIRFFIYDSQKEEVIYENAEPGGKVVWESDQVVHVSSAIVIPNPDSKAKSREYRYHVVNRKKYSGKFLKNQ